MGGDQAAEHVRYIWYWGLSVGGCDVWGRGVVGYMGGEFPMDANFVSIWARAWAQASLLIIKIVLVRLVLAILLCRALSERSSYTSRPSPAPTPIYLCERRCVHVCVCVWGLLLSCGSPPSFWDIIQQPSSSAELQCPLRGQVHRCGVRSGWFSPPQHWQRKRPDFEPGLGTICIFQ